MKDITDWLLGGDVSIRYLVHKTLLKSSAGELSRLQERIGTEGFAAELLKRRGANGHWGQWFYQPKWTSTHYTLTDLMDLGVPRSCPSCREMTARAFDECQLMTGGVNFAKSKQFCDVCVDGMVLRYAAYFLPDDRRAGRLAAFLLGAQQDDGGFGWDPDGGVSDAHTTICVLEGFLAYREAGFADGLPELGQAERLAVRYLFDNGLFMDGDPRFQKLSYPYRYRCDLLRVLEYFASAALPYDPRMRPALGWLLHKRRRDGRWDLENVHRGNAHITMEQK